MTHVDVEWFGGPMDGKVTRVAYRDLKAGAIVYHQDSHGVRTDYVTHVDPLAVDAVSWILALVEFESEPHRCERWTYRVVRKGRKGQA